MARRSKSPRPPHYGNIPQEEVERRWRQLTPMFVKSLILFTLATVGVYLANHYIQFNATTFKILNIAFQVLFACAGLFAFLTLMALLFGRTDQPPPR